MPITTSIKSRGNHHQITNSNSTLMQPFSQIWDAQACESLYEMKREKSWELCQQEEPGLMTVWK